MIRVIARSGRSYVVGFTRRGLPLVLLLLIAACNHDPHVTEVDYPATEGGKIYFMTQSRGSNTDDADLVGVLELVDGCLQIRHNQIDGGEPMTVVWPEGFGIGVGDDQVTVRDRSGRVVAQVGQRTLLGGGGSLRKGRLGGCEEPFWHGGSDVFAGDAIPSVFD